MEANNIQKPKIASIIILTYNSSKDIEDCLSSMINQSYEAREIIVLDSASQDNTVELVRNKFPEVKVIESKTNLGYAAGNNLAIQYATGEYIVIVNPDTIADPNWLRELLKPFDSNSEKTITTSKILLYSDKTRINTCANHTHFTGLGFCRGLDMPDSEFINSEFVGAISGCSFAITRKAIMELGGFDSDFFLYMEDVDFSWRARLAGYQIIYSSASIIYHKYSLSTKPWKEFYLERNRYVMLLKNYDIRTILILLPAFMATETITWGHAILNGRPYIRFKLQAYYWILSNLKNILSKRKEVQNNRRIGDKKFIELLEFEVPFNQIVKNKALLFLVNGIFNNFFKVYYNMTKALVYS